MRNLKYCWWIALILGLVDWTGAAAPKPVSKIKFYDVRVQTAEFMGYCKSIKLTPAQEKIKNQALSAIPAPCCSDFSVATCCCPCNMAKSIWGLSHFLIAKKNSNATHVKETVTAWIHFINENGFDGNTCNEGRCGFPFKESGCGGMKEGNVIF